MSPRTVPTWRPSFRINALHIFSHSAPKNEDTYEIAIPYEENNFEQQGFFNQGDQNFDGELQFHPNANAMHDDLLNSPICSHQSQHRLPACPRSTTLTWWWPTCGPSCRSLRRKILGCRKELRTWKRRGTSSGVSWTASSSPQRARDRNRVRASTVMVRSETGVRWACTANLESNS